MDTDLQTLSKQLEQTKGVKAVSILDRSEGEKLLIPWIGAAGLDGLPIPRLIRVVVDVKSPPDFGAMDEAVRKNVPTARLDTHRRWESELQRMASTLTLLSSLILTLISLSAVAMVVFAARAVLEANRTIVDVLHIAGADDDFIANAINKRFIAAGAMSGVFGLLGGVLTFFLLGHWRLAENNGVAAAARGLFYLPQDSDWRSMLWFLLVPVFATVIALVTSRFTLMRMLRDVR
jgi:cell division transport system permease protein